MNQALTIESNNRSDSTLTTDLSTQSAPRRMQPRLFLIPETLQEKEPFTRLVKSYFRFLLPIELVVNVMLLAGEFDAQKVAENINLAFSNPLDYPLEQDRLKQIPLLQEVKRICIKYQNEASQYMLFRPDINSVGNALLLTGNFSVDRVVNEIGGLNKRPRETTFFYRPRPKPNNISDNIS